MTVPRWTDTARRLRREMSLPEVLLWEQLRLRPQGVKFRRQHALGDYVLDFYCAPAKLAVEIDGRTHDSSTARDAVRDDWLAMRGIRTVRIAAPTVLADPAGIAAWLAAEATAILPVGGEVARSAGAGGDREIAAARSNPPPSGFACHLSASGEDRAPRARQDQGPLPCR